MVVNKVRNYRTVLKPATAYPRGVVAVQALICNGRSWRCCGEHPIPQGAHICVLVERPTTSHKSLSSRSRAGAGEGRQWSKAIVVCRVSEITSQVKSSQDQLELRNEAANKLGLEGGGGES